VVMAKGIWEKARRGKNGCLAGAALGPLIEWSN
jgi:hypothetical protein